MKIATVLAVYRALGAMVSLAARMLSMVGTVVALCFRVAQAVPVVGFLMLPITYYFGSWVRSFIAMIFDLIAVFRAVTVAAPPPPPASVSVWIGWLEENWLVALLTLVALALAGGCFLMAAMLRWTLNRPVKVVRQIGLEADRFVIERSVDGSSYFQIAPPAFQASVYVLMEGVWYRSGGCFRMADGIMTCFHVIAGAERVKIVRGDLSEEYGPEEFEHLERLGDVALARRAPTWLRQAKLSSAALSTTDKQMVMVHNGDLASMGPLTGANGFGLVSYGGSTAKGFSGSPYYMGNVVYGLHFGAQAVNMGYEAAYLQLLIAQEGSDGYYLDLIERDEKHEMMVSPYDPDEVAVKMRGKYLIMDAADYYSARDKRRTVRESLPRAPLVEFRDSENYERPAAHLSAAGPNSQVEGPAPATRSLTLSETALPCPARGPPPVMPPPEPMPVRSEGVLSGTLLTLESMTPEDLKALAREVARKVGKRLQTRKKLTPRSQPSRTVTSDPGALTSTPSTSAVTSRAASQQPSRT